MEETLFLHYEGSKRPYFCIMTVPYQNVCLAGEKPKDEHDKTKPYLYRD